MCKPLTPSFLLVVSPQPRYFHNPLFCQHLVYEPVLHINTPGVCARQIANELLKRRRFLKWVYAKNLQELFSFEPETG